PWLVRLLGMADDGSANEQELHARIISLQAARERITKLAEEWPDHLPLVETLEAQYSHRATHLDEIHSHELDGTGHPLSESAAQEIVEHGQIRRAVIDAERQAVLMLRERGEIGDEAWRRIERDLDLEELRLEA